MRSYVKDDDALSFQPRSDAFDLCSKLSWKNLLSPAASSRRVSRPDFLRDTSRFPTKHPNLFVLVTELLLSPLIVDSVSRLQRPDLRTNSRGSCKPLSPNSSQAWASLVPSLCGILGVAALGLPEQDQDVILAKERIRKDRRTETKKTTESKPVRAGSAREVLAILDIR